MKRKTAFTTALLVLTILSVQGQNIRIKGLFLPFYEHSVGIETLLNQNFSAQVIYQNEIEWGDNQYYHHRLIPSIRYYQISNNKIFNHLYIEAFYRLSFIQQHPDQSDVAVYNYTTSSLGLSAGRQFFLNERFFIDFSFGHYYIYSDNERHDYSDHNIFPYQYRHRWRIDFKLGLTFKGKESKY